MRFASRRKPDAELCRGAAPGLDAIAYGSPGQLIYKAGMTHPAAVLSLLVLGLSPLLAAADARGGERGRGHGYTQVHWDGPCKIERKFRPDGSHKEERKCRGPQARNAAGPVAVVLPAPVIVAAPVMVQPGIVIQASVHMR